MNMLEEFKIMLALIALLMFFVLMYFYIGDEE